MPPGIRLRVAGPEDQPFLLKLSERLGDFPVPPWRTRSEIGAADHAILLDALGHPTRESTIRVAETPEGQPLGYVFVTTRKDYFTRQPHAHVEILALAPEAEGRGIARVLMQAAEEWSREQGYSRVTLNVFATNQRALGLYEHLGYRPETVHYLKDL
ncbi:MAG TPA: GNAT family N-acetyltransferase [Gemmatimonadales bacterium]|nr:GNAT family N-acetyltransferase [Gemmatimonadales bacterium]